MAVMRRNGTALRAAHALLALLACLPPAASRSEVPPPGPRANNLGPIGARYPLQGGRFTSRYSAPLPDIAPTLEQLIKRSPWDFDPKTGLHVDGFTLWMVDDLGRPLPSLQQHIRLHGRDLVHGNYHLSIQLVNAPALTDFYCYIRYHQERWAPVSAEPGSAFGLAGDRLWLDRMDMPGLVGIGVTRVRPDFHGGIKFQDGVVGAVVFTERPFDGKPNLLDRAPDKAYNKPRNFTAYIEPDTIRGPNSPLGPDNPQAGEVTLYWVETNEGDLNNDGEVGLGDLTPLGRRYGRISTDGHDDAWDLHPDANGDGEVNYKDAFVIERNFGVLLSGYRVYRRPAGSKPRGPEDMLLPHRTNPILPLSIHRPTAWDPSAQIEYRFVDKTLPYDAATRRWIYRIVPYNARGDREGQGSELEVEISVGAEGVRVLRGGETSPRETGRDVTNPRVDESGRQSRDTRIERGM